MPPTLVTAEAADVLTSKKTTPLPAPARRPGGRGGWLVLGAWWALAVSFIVLTATNYRRVALAADRMEALYRATAWDGTGRGALAPYAATQPPVMFDPDGHSWIVLTQRQIAQGTVRPHDYPFDNAPYGRQRHWSSSFSWWLLILGTVTRAWTGWPLAQAVGQSAAWANPVLFVLFLGALGLTLRRRLDPWSNGILLVTLAASSGVEWDFSYGRPDHHGLHLMAFLGLVLGALAGGLGWVRVETDADDPAGPHLVRPRTRRESRRWFTASAVCGGVGLWIGSTQQCVCIGTLGAGAVLGALLFARPRTAGATYHFEPALWRHWARVGAATSLFFYLVEYFPTHLEVHLEVNHPFVALAWLGAGELMYVLLTARVDWLAVKARRGEMGLRIAAGLAGMAALPLAVKGGPATWYVLGDPVIRRLFRVVSEGQPWVNVLNLGGTARTFWEYTGALTLALPTAGGLLLWGRRSTPPWRLAGVTVALTLAGMFLAWTLAQSRWVGFLETSLAVLALLAAPGFRLPGVVARQARAVPLVLLALTVPGWAGYGRLQMNTLAENPMLHARATLGEMMATKEAAWNLRRDADRLGLTAPVRVMAGPAPGPVLHYYGGVDVVGSYYWENLAGCHAAVDFFMDVNDDATARRIARERRIDFVAVTAKPAFVLELQWLQVGRTDLPAARRSLAFRLTNPLAARPPAWLEEQPLVDAPLARGEGWRIYRVVKARL